MKYDEYEDYVDKLFKWDGDVSPIIHAAMGIAGESGEIVDIVKKAVFYGKEGIYDDLVEELGDLQFYVTAMLLCIGVDARAVRQRNIDKLLKRYPTGTYSDADALARADKEKGPERP